MKDEVKELQVKINLFIKIDQERREMQVREATETQYFEELRKRVQILHEKKE